MANLTEKDEQSIAQSALAKAISRTREQDGEQATATSIEYLCVRIADRRYAFPIRYVVQILAPALVTRVPHVPDYVLGVINRQGKTSCVFDMAKYVGFRADETPARFVALESGVLDAVIPVSEILGLVVRDTAEVEPPLAHIANAMPFVRGQIHLQGGVVLVVDVSRLLEQGRLASERTTET